jgi:hypothetical protein
MYQFRVAEAVSQWPMDGQNSEFDQPPVLPGDDVLAQLAQSDIFAQQYEQSFTGMGKSGDTSIVLFCFVWTLFC